MDYTTKTKKTLAPSLKILSWNIQSSKSNYTNKFLDSSFTKILSEHDILCLQEIRQAVKLPGYRSFCNLRPGEKHGGVGILYKNELIGGVELVKKHKLEDVIICKLNRSFFKLNNDVFIINAYVTPYTSTATKSFDGRKLLQEISNTINEISIKGDIILCGDFNSRISDAPGLLNENTNELEHIPLPCDYTPDNFSIRCTQDMQSNAYGKDFLSLVLNNRLNILNGRMLGDLTGAITCITSNGCSIVDYFVMSHSLMNLAMHFSVLPFTQYSDHKPLSLSLSTNKLHLFNKTSIGNKYKSAPTRFLFDEDSKSKFTNIQSSDHYRQQLNYLNNLLTENELDYDHSTITKLNDDFTNYLHDMASKCLKSTKNQNDSKKKLKHNPWFNVHCRMGKRELNKAARTTSKFPTSQFLRSNYYKVKSSYKSLIKRHKNNYFEKLNKDIEEGKILNWNHFKKLKSKMTDKDEFDCQDMINFEKFFAKLYSDNHATVDATQKQTYIQTADNINNSTLPGPPTLNDAISTTDVNTTISSLKSGKASSLDMISNEILKYLDQLNVNLITRLFNLCLDSGTYPWNVNIITPLHKKGNKDDPDNYRAIAVSSVIGKLFSTILLNRLIKYRNANCPDPPNQLGFTKKAQTYDHILTMHTIASKYKKLKRNVYAVFVDFRKAFDSVCRQALFYKLAQNGVTGKFYNVLKDMYINSYGHIKLSGYLSNRFDIRKGTEQGHPLSPDLFKLFLSDLSPLLESINCPTLTNISISHLLWADDLILLSLDQKTSQHQIDTLSKFCTQWGIEVNKLKTKVVIFGNKRSTVTRTNINFQLDGEPLDIVDSYCYLGITLHNSGNFNIALNDLKCKAMRAMFGLKRTVIRSKLSFRSLTTLFDSLIKPIIMYGAPIWTPNLSIIKNLSSAILCRPNQLLGIISKINRVSVESVHQFFLKWALGTHKKSSNIGTLGESGRYPLIYQATKLTLNYYERLTKLDHGSFAFAALQEQQTMMLPWYKNIEALLKIDEIFHQDHVTAYRAKTEQTKNNHIQTSNNTQCHVNINPLFMGDVSSLIHIKPLPSKQFRLHHILKRLREHFKDCWEHDKSNSPKLAFYHHIKKNFSKEPYLDIVKNPSHRYRTTQLRISSHDLSIEKGRYKKIIREDRVCTWCSLTLGDKIVEDEYHVLFNCYLYNDLRVKLTKNLIKTPNFDDSLSISSYNFTQLNNLIYRDSLILMKLLSPNTSTILDNEDPFCQHHFHIKQDPSISISPTSKSKARSHITNSICAFIAKTVDKRWSFLQEIPLYGHTVPTYHEIHVRDTVSTRAEGVAERGNVSLLNPELVPIPL